MRSSKRYRVGHLLAGGLVVGAAIVLAVCAIKEEAAPSQTLLTPDEGTSKLNGDWVAPCVAADNGSSDQVVLTFENKDQLITYLHWKKPTDDCSGTPTRVTPYSGKISLVGTKKVTWDGATPSGLSDKELATTFTTNLKDEIASGGDTLTALANVGIIDESVDPRVLYLGSTLDSTLPVDKDDGFPKQLSPDGFTED